MLRCGENTKSIIPLVSKAINSGTIIISNVLYVKLKKQDLLKNKKQNDYYVIYNNSQNISD